MTVPENIWALLTTVAIGATTVFAVVANIAQVAEGAVKLFNFLFRRKKKETPEPQPKRKTLSNLPACPYFIGRQAAKEQVLQSLEQHSLTVISGSAGIGKSTLALNVIADVLAGTRFKNLQDFDAAVWVTAKDELLDTNLILDSVARVLDYPYITQLSSDEKLHESIKLLTKHKILLAIDNFESIVDPRIQLLMNQIPQGNRILVTTRHRFTWNCEHNPVDVSSLSREDSYALIRHEMKRLSLAVPQGDEEGGLEQLYEATGGSPLAIKWAIGQMKVKGATLTDMICFLNAAEGDLFETMFASAWAMLETPERSVVFAMLRFAAPAPRPALQAAVNLPDNIFREALGKLVRLSLVDSNHALTSEKQMLSFHPLTKSYVQREFDHCPDCQKLLETALGGLMEYYLAFARKRNARQMGSGGYDEIEAELKNILRLTQDANRLGTLDRAVADMGNAISVFLWSRGYWSDRIAVGQLVIHSAGRLRDFQSAGRHAYFIGIVYFWQGDLPQAKQWLAVSRDFMDKNGLLANQCLAQRLAALICVGDKKFDDAIEMLKQVLVTISDASAVSNSDTAVFADWVAPGPQGYQAGIVALLQELGISYNRKKDFEGALPWLEKSLELAREIGDVEGQSISYSHLGHALYGLGKIPKAKKCYAEGLELAQKVQRKSTMARCTQGMSYVLKKTHHSNKSQKYAAEAVDLFERLGMQAEASEVRSLFRL